MKDSTPDCPPFTRLQLDRLEELKAEIEKRDTLSALDPEVPKINKRIDELSVKVSRFALKNIPKESRRPGEFIIELPTYGGRLLAGKHRLEIKPGFAIFHPDTPLWAKNHFIEWIREHRAGFRRYDGREVLRETGIIGVKIGMKSPIDFEDIKRWELIKERVLELRGVQKEESEDDDSDLIPAISPALAIESSPYPLGELEEDCRIKQELLLKCSRKPARRRKENEPGKIMLLGIWSLIRWWKRNCGPEKLLVKPLKNF